MHKGFKFRMYPSDKQKGIINMNFRTKRFIYNHYLEEVKTSGKLNTKLNITRNSVNNNGAVDSVPFYFYKDWLVWKNF